VRRGEGGASLELLKEARRYGIPILEDEQAARRIAAEDNLPEDLYEKVAEAFIRYKVVS
jgi:type III secretion system FlhB-like substrate exporter